MRVRLSQSEACKPVNRMIISCYTSLTQSGNGLASRWPQVATSLFPSHCRERNSGLSKRNRPPCAREPPVLSLDRSNGPTALRWNSGLLARRAVFFSVRHPVICRSSRRDVEKALCRILGIGIRAGQYSTERMALLSKPTFNLSLANDAPDLGRKFLSITVIPLMLISILAPVVRLNDEFWLKPDQLLLPVIAIVYVWLMLAGMARPIPPNPMYVVALVFCGCICMSLVYGTEVIGHHLQVNDFFEFPRAAFPVLFFTLAYEADLPENSLRTLAAMLVPAILLISLYAYGQWFNLGFTHYLQPYYSGGFHDDGSLSHYRRVYSTLSNPNTLGILMTWVITAFALAALFRVGRRFWILAALVASLITLAMTGSRYGLIDTVFALIAIFLLPAPTAKSKMERHTALLVSLPLVLGVILVVAGTNRATLERFEMLRTPMKENSLRMRLDSAWLDAADLFLQSPVFGQGPAKDIFSGVVTDSEYLNILKKFGVVGLIPYLCFFLVPLAMIWKGLKNVTRAGPQLEQHWRATYWGLCLGFLVPVTCLAMNVGMGTYYETTLVAFIWMWMGIGVSCANRVVRLAEMQVSLPRH